MNKNNNIDTFKGIKFNVEIGSLYILDTSNGCDDIACDVSIWCDLFSGSFELIGYKDDDFLLIHVDMTNENRFSLDHDLIDFLEKIAIKKYKEKLENQEGL